MACFLVPAAEAVITTIVTKAMKSSEKQSETVEVQLGGTQLETVEKLPFREKLNWLSNLLWGGSALLTFEHVWHGEVVPWFPFLTAASNPTDAAEMLHEMSTVGTSMAVLVTVVWFGMLGVTSMIEKKALKPQIFKN